MDNKITYIEDLAKELEEEFGMTEKEALEICRLNVDHVYDLIRVPDIISIRFPMLGTMHVNRLASKYGYMFKEFKELMARKVEIIEEQLKDSKDLVHGRKSYYSILRKYFYKDFRLRNAAKRQEVYRKIELKQNK